MLWTLEFFAPRYCLLLLMSWRSILALSDWLRAGSS